MGGKIGENIDVFNDTFDSAGLNYWTK